MSRQTLAVIAAATTVAGLALGASSLTRSSVDAGAAAASRSAPPARTVAASTVTNSQERPRDPRVQVLGDHRSGTDTYTLVTYTSDDGLTCLGWSDAPRSLPSNCLEPAFEKEDRALVTMGALLPETSAAEPALRLVWGYARSSADRVTLTDDQGEVVEASVFGTAPGVLRGRTVYIAKTEPGRDLTVRAVDAQDRLIAEKELLDPAKQYGERR